jgi:hypothetical protein
MLHVEEEHQRADAIGDRHRMRAELRRRVDREGDREARAVRRRSARVETVTPTPETVMLAGVTLARLAPPSVTSSGSPSVARSGGLRLVTIGPPAGSR